MRRQLVRGSFGRSVVSILGLAAMAVAQDAGAAVPAAAPAAVPAAAPAASLAVPASTPAVEGAMAVVLAESCKLRCWPTATSPSYEDRVAKDAVLRVGRSEGGFREVLLPIGPLGYVHQDFAAEPAEGQVATKGRGVAFRYRPRSGEAPITSLPTGTKLFVVGKKDAWWCVRNPGVTAWLPEAELQVFAAPPETMTKANAEFEKLQRGEVAAYLEGIQRALAARQLADSRRKALGELQEQFSAELQKAPAEQQLDAVAAAAAAMQTDSSDDPELLAAVKELQRRVGAQKWVVEATAVRDAEPVPAKEVATAPPGPVADPFDRFQAVGFLRWEKGLTGPGNYVVEKGGQRLYYVTCISGRYELGLFVDCEVGVIGSRRRPGSESMRVLDAERIEVLAGRH